MKSPRNWVMSGHFVQIWLLQRSDFQLRWLGERPDAFCWSWLGRSTRPRGFPSFAAIWPQRWQVHLQPVRNCQDSRNQGLFPCSYPLPWVHKIGAVNRWNKVSSDWSPLSSIPSLLVQSWCSKEWSKTCRAGYEYLGALALTGKIRHRGPET